MSHEMVWVVPAQEINRFDGLSNCAITTEISDLEQVPAMLGTAFFNARQDVEESPLFKQIIPYLIVSCGGKILSYTRAGTEKRLTGLVSIGLGGHLNPEDAHERYTEMVRLCARREVAEELYIEGVDNIFTEFPSHFVLSGVVYDDSDDVGKVHLGLVLRCDVSEGVAQKLRLSDENKDMEWKTWRELQEGYEELEGWSQICVDVFDLFPKVGTIQ